MAHIEIDQEKIRIDSDYQERELIKRVPGTTWDSTEKVWRVPLSWAACIALRGVFGDNLTVGPELMEWSWNTFQTRVEPAHNVRTAMEFEPLIATEPDLYPFQRAGVEFLSRAQQALIADEMGAGKTVQLVRTVARFAVHGNFGGSLPALVVAPNSMKMTWAKEFNKWAPELNVTVLDGTAAKRRKQIATITDGDADILVVNWEALRLYSKLESFGNKTLTDKEKEPKEFNAIHWGTVIADEAHKAKDPNAKQTRALWAVSRNARFRFAATGTPVANKPDDLWSIMNFVSPDDFPRKSKFVDRYCDTSFNPWGGMEVLGLKASTSEEFHNIVDSRMIRRLKDVVLPHLPPKVYSSRVVPMGTKQAKAYYQMAEHMLVQLQTADMGDGIISATNPLALMTRLGQFACATAEVNEDGEVRLTDPSSKVDALMEILDEAEGEQVVVFAESRQLIELAAAQLDKAKISYGVLTGAASIENRQIDIDNFQDGKLRVMLVTLGAGGEGITLTAARIAVFLQRSWSLVKNKQAEDRIHRPGQDGDKVEIIDLVSAGTIEEYRNVKLAEKEDRLQEVVQDDELRKLLTYKGE